MPGAPLFRTVAHCFRAISSVLVDLVRLAALAVHVRRALAAENLFRRKQLPLFRKRKLKSRRADDSTCRMGGSPTEVDENEHEAVLTFEGATSHTSDPGAAPAPSTRSFADEASASIS